jgi:hypothetical protein
MSTDFDLRCTTCGKTLATVASSSIAYGDKLWQSPESLEALRAFLFEHRGHALVFDDMQLLDDDD